MTSALTVNPRKIGRFRSDQARARFHEAYDNALAAWKVPPEHVDVATRYGATHVLCAGHDVGTPIVLLHALAVASPSWFANIEALSATHPVFAIDTVADVGRTKQTTPVRSGEEMSIWLDEVLESLGLEQVHLVGLSYGGWLALNHAQRSPWRLASVTSVDPPNAIGRGQLSFLIKILPDSLLAIAKSDQALYRLLRRLNNGTIPTEPLLDLAVTGLRTFVGRLPTPKRMSDDDLRKIRTPCFLIFCGRSPVNRAHRAVERSRRLIAQVTTDVIEDAGHMLPVEAPEVFADRLLTFIDSLDATNRAADSDREFRVASESREDGGEGVDP